jgi:DDE family transposase
MSWCEHHGVDYVFGLARNPRLRRCIDAEMEQARALYGRTQQAARLFTEFTYQTHDSWSCSRRVIGKAEQLEKGENPRFVVTSLTAERIRAQPLYEQLYCARGEIENRIKEQFCLFSDRTSTAYLRSNQLRLYLSSMAYLLLQGLRRLGLHGTTMAQAQCQTIRLQLLKIGALVRITVRKVWVSFSSGYPHQVLFAKVFHQLRC